MGDNEIMAESCSLTNPLAVLQAIRLKVVEASPDAKIVINDQQIIVDFNAKAEFMFGWDRTEVLGKPIEFLLPDSLADAHKKGNYILDSLKYFWHRIRRTTEAYDFLPIKIWIAVVLGLIPWLSGIGVTVAVPATINSSARHLAAGKSSDTFSRCMPTTIFVTEIPTATWMPRGVMNMAAAGQERAFQPAFSKAVSIKHRNPVNSVSLECNAISYSVPENCFRFSGIRTICRPVRILDALNFANSWIASCAFRLAMEVRSSASDAFWTASAARPVASATFSSDLRFISWPRLNPIRLNWTSPATPIKTSAFANVDPHRLQTESYGGWSTPRITSAISPNATSPPKYQLQFSQESAEASKSSSLAFVTPFMRRHAGKGFRGFWFGTATGLLMFALLFIAHYFDIVR